MSERRVVITGVSSICPLGNEPDKIYQALCDKVSGIDFLKSVPPDFLPCKIGGEASCFTGAIEDYGTLEKSIMRPIKKGRRLMCREIEMGVAAAQLAIQSAGLNSESYDQERIGSIYGSDYILTPPDEFIAGVQKCLDESGDFDFSTWAENGLPQLAPLWLLKYLPNMPASHIAIYNQFRGPSNSITSREASANLAIGEAYTTIVRGGADAIIAGATGTRVHPVRSLHVSLQEQLAEVNGDPTQASRPFDSKRSGMVMGEGAGAVMLEELESAKARGAEILAEICGYGSSTVLKKPGIADFHLALRNTILAALRTSDMQPEQIGHIHAHGLSAVRCDQEEAQAIKDVFGDQKPDIPVVAAKGNFGNLGAASGVVEAISSISALQTGTLFPVLNYESSEDSIDINICKSAEEAGANFINLNVTPQGQASAIVISKFAA